MNDFLFSAKGFLFSKKGFLFTISIIMFASTLVFFAQSYSKYNSLNETSIVSSAKAENISLLNEDISFGLRRLFGVSLDANKSSTAIIFASGRLSSSPVLSSALSSYESHITNKLFPLVSGVKALDFSSISDGKAEVYFGDSIEFDFAYSSNEVSIYPVLDKSLLQIDVNLKSYNDINRIGWVVGPVLGSTVFNFNFVNDSNSFNFSQLIDPNSLSTLVLYYPDSNIVISFGNISGVVNSGVKISDINGQMIDYALGAHYSDANVFPIVWNAKLRYSSTGVDSNSMLVIRK